MNSRLGLAGVLLFGLGGFFLYFGLNEIVHRPTFVSSSLLFGFLGFLMVGFGLWSLIVGGKTEDETRTLTKLTKS